MTTVRLAWGGPLEAQAKSLGPREVTTTRLVYNPSDRLAQASPLEGAPAEADRPALLVSYYYLQGFERQRHRYAIRNWSMDSGAFSAANAGKKITVAEYHEACHRLLADDPTLVEVFALDVLGDWRASRANTERAWSEGIPAIPTYHVGEPEQVLVDLAREYPKIALGGAVRYKHRDAWAAQCFARVWPKPIHGLGFGAVETILAMPFHSVDASSWEIGATAFGNWRRYGKLSVRGGNQNLRGEVEFYLDLERKARTRWHRELAQLDEQLRQIGWRGV